MDYMLSIIVGVLSSLTASVIFLFAVSRLRPHVEISKQIAKWHDWKGDTVYKIKIINRTHRPIINIKARMHFLIPSVAPEGIIYKTIEVPLKRSDPMEIAAFDSHDKEAKYAYRFISYKDIDTLWHHHDNTLIRFRLFAVDSLSGFGKVFTQDFHVKRDTLVEGDFIFGDSLGIK